MVEAAAFGLVAGGDDPAHERRPRAPIGAVGGIGRAADVRLVGDLEVLHLRVAAELAHAGAHEGGESGHVASRALRAVRQDHLDGEAVGVYAAICAASHGGSAPRSAGSVYES